MNPPKHPNCRSTFAPVALTLDEIDSRLRGLWVQLCSYRTGHDTALSPLEALELIDELLDARYTLQTL